MIRTVCFYDPVRQEIYFIYQGFGSTYPNKGIILTRSGAVWPISFNGIKPTAAAPVLLETNTRLGDLTGTIGSYNQQLGELRKSYNKIVMAHYTGQVVQEEGLTDLGTAIPLSLESAMVQSPDDPRRYFSVVESDHLFAQANAYQEVAVQLGHAEAGQEPIYTTAQTVNIGNPGKIVIGHKVTDRMFSFKLTASATQLVKWRGSFINGVMRGYR
jgi:hypothetical protein